MIELNLEGIWNLKDKENEYNLQGYLPGCNYLDLMNAGIIEDVFYGVNEYKYKWVPEKDWEYKRKFILSDELVNKDYIFLNIRGADTLVDIYINNTLISKTRNAHIDYSVDIKEFVISGENSVSLYIHSPVHYINGKQKEDKSPVNLMGISGFPHIRKPACHFGWDWGPVLPPSGITGYIKITAYDHGYIADFVVNQRLITFDKAELNVFCNVKNALDLNDYYIDITVTDDKQQVIFNVKRELYQNTDTELINIMQPELWTLNGATNRKTQPLYNVQCQLLYKDKQIDKTEQTIGIREIELDTSKDEYGDGFAFKINGKRIFAKGGNWIPTDSFITRKTEKDIEYFVRSCFEANMNMIRVWGGGYYESDTFYRLCDKYGILVWQDFAFACQPYPFYNEEYLSNVKDEVTSVVKRLRHHPSLCLWCGNNEIESMTFRWLYKKKTVQWTKKFFYEILPEWLKELNSNTPYWYSSPSGGEFMKKINSDNNGDTHLWHVWHGLMPFDYYHKRFTRFCSEFGFESLPDIDTVAGFCQEKDFDLFSEPLLSHQKCRSGNDKIMYYMIENYCIPEKFSELIYVSQLVQAESIKAAVEHWRRNAGQCNGALYWQLNDCWPVLSWAGMDYTGRWKALQYYAKRFFNPVAITFLNYRDINFAIMVNDKDMDINGTLEWQISDFDGKILMDGKSEISIKENSQIMLIIQTEQGFIKKHKNNCFIYGVVKDQDGNIICDNTLLYNKVNKVALKKASIDKRIIKKDDNFEITLTSDTFTKNVFVHIKDVKSPLSDNFFDLRKGQSKTIFVKTENVDIKELEKRIEIICYNNIVPKYTKTREKLIKTKIALQPTNFFSRILYKFM